MFLLKISEPPGEMLLVGYLAGKLIVILVVSFLNTPILRLSADLVVKRMPRLTTAFYISFSGSAMFVIGAALAARFGQPHGGSVLDGGSSVAAIDSPVMNFLPLIFLFVSVWVFSAKCFTDDESKAVGFGRGLIVAAIDSALMVVIGATLFFVFAYWT
jgi:hypothetical protein